ncbi:NADH-quinone oxidoreductase subunit C [Pinisolibacter sp.]|uniref:NADH-quinone oxidoreductase subunit C n=1 Tax=Pinisolibacter sp. TaxID=2172024 RepID=UPI002FDC9381
MRTLLESLKERFPLGPITEQRPDLAFVTVERETLRPLIVHLRDREGFTHLVLLTAVDWIEENLFQLTYLVHDRANARDIGLRVMLPRDEPEMESIHDLWPTAATYQRELKEMFGIPFPGSPRLDEEFILEGWVDIPPYRRDFDTLKFAEENFEHRAGRGTTDPATHMRERMATQGGSK